MSAEDIDRLAKIEESTRRQVELAEAYMAENPEADGLTAMMIGGDRASMERARQALEDGKPAVTTLAFVGSYARLAWVYELWERGALSDDWMFENWLTYWRGSDPDDTDERFLDMWVRLWERNGRRPLRDGPHLPKGRTLTVWRGQIGDTPGWAWSLNRKVASMFAVTGGLRQPMKGGRLLQAEVPRSAVLAYVTGRHEEEVVFDSRMLVETS